ncbi:MAG TPA: UDP-3-O-(3-hydroxymyristoyl)glucosamine N-acyltransferase [Chlamydiales bacterium]|nr:UDP-3-O-(3-hydroxymyristoyl)glucosamine N-acyltransferase [Chlamydiales bacterium]
MKSFSLKELSKILAAQLVGNPDHEIIGVNTLDEANQEDLSFLANPRYLEAMKKSRAGAICVDQSTLLSEGKNYLICENPSAAFQKIAEWLLLSSPGSAFQGIHPTAVIHESVQIGTDVSIGPHVVIDRGCVIGAGTTIAPNVSIGYETHIGADCIIHSGCTIRERCRLGERVILQPGAVIGSCGFGYTQDKFGCHIKLEQLGIVILEDDVEIGANTTIDRSRFKSTIIRKGSKLDNLCQIAHNVEIGEHNIMAAQTGVAGSAKTGKHVMLGGQVGILGHVELEEGVLVATRGGVSKSLKRGKYRGSPAIPLAEYNRQEVHVRKLEEYVERLKRLEQKLAALSG